MLGKAKATSPAVVSQGAVLRGCSALPVAGVQHSEAADRNGSALLAPPFWESAGRSPALLCWRCQCKNSLIWSVSSRDLVGTFVLVVLGLNRGKDPTEAIKKSFRNGREASGSLGGKGGGRAAPPSGLRRSRGSTLHFSAVPQHTTAAPVPQVGETGRRKRPPRSPGGGRPAVAPRARPCLHSPGRPPRPAELPPSRGGALRPLPPGSPCPSPKMAASEGEPGGGGGRRAGA